MGGGGSAFLTGYQAYTTYEQSKAEKQSAELEAKQTELQAKADISAVNEELEETLAMQDVLFAGQGRVDEGSTEAVKRGDTKKAASDAIRIAAGGTAESAAQRRAGKLKSRATKTGGLLSTGRDVYDFSQVK